MPSVKVRGLRWWRRANCSLRSPRGGLRPALEELSERRLIEIRYAEEGIYCVRVLAAGREYLPRRRQDAKEAASGRMRVFLCAALGGFAGGLFSALVLVALLL